jgi:hypothetical protein
MLFFYKTKTEPPFPRHEFADRLDKLISDGMRAGMGASEIETVLEQRTHVMRMRQAAAYSSASRVVSGNI